jgi:hypothetical protein
MNGLDWIAVLPAPASGFEIIRNQVELLLSGNAHAVPTATLADAEETIREMCFCSDEGLWQVLAVDHDPRITSKVFRAFAKGIGLCLIFGSAYTDTKRDTKAERAYGAARLNLRPQQQLLLAVSAISNAVSTHRNLGWKARLSTCDPVLSSAPL